MTSAEVSAPDVFVHPLHVGRPNLPDAAVVLQRCAEVLERQWLTNDGPLVRELEAKFAALCQARHAVAVCNATVGLEIAVRAAGLTGEVIVPAFTFVATAHALEWVGLRPVLCDVDLDTHCIDPERVEAAITPQTSAILGVHLWGQACEVDALSRIAERRRLKLMFDAAHAIGCTSGGRPIGGFGLAEVFSLHATKIVNSAEGGIIVTNDDDLAQRMRLMRNFGFAGYDCVVSSGTNGKMSELSAALGISSLEQIDHLIAINRRNYAAYQAMLAGLPGLSLRALPESERHNAQYVVVEVDNDQCPLSRDQLLFVLHRHRVLARRYFYPGLHRMEPYASRDPMAVDRLPMTEQVAAQVLVLPTGSSVTVDDIHQIGRIFRWALASAERLSATLPRLVAPGATFETDQE